MSVLPLFGADDPAQQPESVSGAEPSGPATPLFPESASVPAPTAPSADPLPSSPMAASQSLYRKYRPQSFDADDLVGQEHVVRTLRNAIRMDRIAHAYLFCGPRGTGKTTTARLIAKAVNCLDPDPDRRPCNACASCDAINSGAATDIVEIDAASNRGIDDIRDLRERVKYAPTQLQYKFYIVDEAHQITGAAANAFLKTLEEPPLHTKFVLATTDPEELLPTIVSRCQRFDFRRVSVEAMANRIRTVAGKEGIAVTDEAIAEITRHATGSLRDALGLLDQLALHGGEEGDAVDAEAVRALLGISRNDRVGALLAALADRDASLALETVNTAVDAGEDPRQLNRQLVAALRTILHDRAAGRPTPGDLGPVAARFDLARLADLLRAFGEVDHRIRHSPYAHLPLELALVQSIVGPAPAIAQMPSTAPSHSAPTDPSRQAPAPHRPAETAADSGFDPGAPTNRLRDRVRGEASSPPRTARSSASQPAREPAAERPASGVDTPERQDSPPQESLQQAPASSLRVIAPGDQPEAGPLSLETIVNLWPQIRADVKAFNRRADALLASADPGQVAGNRVTIYAAYEFHRDKLNSDEVRGLLQEIISRQVGIPVIVNSALPNDLGNAGVPSVATTATPIAESPVAPAAASDLDDLRIQAARNIFDADVIDENPERT